MREARETLFASANLELDGVLRKRPLPVDAQLTPHPVEGHQMSVPFGVCQHAVAVEEQRPLHACPSLPNILKSPCARDVTSF